MPLRFDNRQMIIECKNDYFTVYRNTNTVNDVDNFEILLKFINQLEQSKLSLIELSEIVQTYSTQLQTSQEKKAKTFV